MPDIRKSSPSTPIILVGCQSDLRQVPNTATISIEDGRELARKIAAIEYIECSAKMNVCHFGPFRPSFAFDYLLISTSFY